MNKGMTILIASSVLGLVSDLLFHDSIVKGSPNGLSVLAWSAALTTVFLFFFTKHVSDKRALLWLVPINLASAAYMVKDSPVLHSIDVVAIFTSFTLLSRTMKGFDVRSAAVMDIFTAAFSTLVDVCADAIPFFKTEMPWHSLMPTPVRLALPAVARGLLVSIPLLLLFGTLFMTADPAFAGLLSKSLNFNASDLSVHMLLFGGFAWCAAGYLMPTICGAVAKSVTSESTHAPTPTDPTIAANAQNSSTASLPQKSWLGRTEINVVLALVNILFLSFVIVQFRYFFGGASLIETTNDLSYADYTRRGFFELSAVSALVLPMLLVLDWLRPLKGDRLDKLFPAQAAFQILMLFVIMFSACQRMNMYQLEYGMTELRFYVSAFIGWLAVIYLIFAATVLRGRRNRFAYLAILSGFAATAVVQAADPDRMIIAANIERAQQGKAFDAQYALSLSADATSYLVHNLNRLPLKDRQLLSATYLSQHAHKLSYDIRSFNLSRFSAFNAVSENLPALVTMSATSQLIAPPKKQ